MTIADIKQQLSDGSTVRQVIEQALTSAKQKDQHNALLSLTSERALQRADEIDQKIKLGENPGELAGIPFVVKDNFLAFGAPTTAASKMLENFDAPLQATVVEKLEAAGAICIGKANLDAFAHGGSTENSAYGVTKNAVDETRVAGGSSGGSAVVTALGIVPFALGTDTGGSIRQPASFNGIYGAKPTYGMISRYGVVAMSSSADCVGCFTTNTADMTQVLSVMAGRDARDMTTYPDYFKPQETAKNNQKIGLVKQSMTDDVDESVRQRMLEFADKLRAAGHEVEEVDLPMMKYSLSMYYIIVPAEVSSNLARYDGIRYGLRASNSKNLSELYGQSRNLGFVAENKRRIMIGSYVLSSGYFDAYYLKAQKARTLLIREYNKLFETYDALLLPTTASPAFKIGENADDPVKMYMTDIMTVPANMAGVPAYNLPIGTSPDGLPIGAQLVGPMKSDANLLALLASMEDK